MMAEGGRETDPLIPVITKDDYNDNEGAGPSRNPFDPADHTGGDEATELHKFRSTSSRRGSAADTSTAKTLFMGNGARSKLRVIESRKDESEYELKKWYPNANSTIVKARLGEYGELRVSLIKGKGTEFTIRPDGTVGKSAKGSKPSDTLLNALGKNVSAKYDDEIANINSRKRELEARDANFQIALQNEFERVSRLEEELRNADQSKRRELENERRAARVEKERSESQRRGLEKERRELLHQKRDIENQRQELEQNEAISRYEAIRDQADRITERIDELRNDLLNADENQKENIKRKIREELAELAMLEGWAEEF